MTTDRDLDGIAMAWLADGPEELSDRVLGAIAAEVHLTRQRHSRVPWRYQRMSIPIRAATAAVIGVLVIGGFVFFTRPGGSGVGGPGPTPSAIPTPATSPSVGVSASPAAIPLPALTKTFTSPRHGYTVHYPEGWMATPATKSWAVGTETLWGDPALDSVGSSEARLSVASQPLGTGQTADEWLVAYCGASATTGASCGPAIDIGDKTGYVDEDGGSAAGGTVAVGGVIFDAAVVAGGRGYEFTLDGHVDRALFDALLSSVTFDTASAVDLPQLTGTFSSPRYGYTIGIATGWTPTPGTKAWTGLDDSPPAADAIAVTGTDTTVVGTSQELPTATTFDAWLALLHADALQKVPSGCDGGEPATWPVIQLGSESGRLEMLCNAASAFVSVGDRVYEFDWTNTSFDPASHIGLGSWKELLKSVTFEPAAAQ